MAASKQGCSAVYFGADLYGYFCCKYEYDMGEGYVELKSSNIWQHIDS